MSRDSINELRRFDRELADEEEEEALEEADVDEEELDPVDVGAVLILADADLWIEAADEDDLAAMAARMNGAFMTVSTLDARK